MCINIEEISFFLQICTHTLSSVEIDLVCVVNVSRVCVCVCVCVCMCVYVCVCERESIACKDWLMGWLWLVGSIKS